MKSTMGMPVVIICLVAVAPAHATWPEARAGAFDAYWAVSGTVHTVEITGHGMAAAGGLTGTLTVQTTEGARPSFETDCVIFADDRTGGTGRCVWTATSGDQVFVELRSSGPVGSGRARGSFTGGTGRFVRIEGQFDFEWNYSVRGRGEASLDGATMAMQGRYRMPRH